MKYHLGDTKILENLPKSITVLGDPYILQQVSEKKYVLFSAICPHMHNVVSHITEEFLAGRRRHSTFTKIKINQFKNQMEKKFRLKLHWLEVLHY